MYFDCWSCDTKCEHNSIVVLHHFHTFACFMILIIFGPSQPHTIASFQYYILSFYSSSERWWLWLGMIILCHSHWSAMTQLKIIFLPWFFNTMRPSFITQQWRNGCESGDCIQSMIKDAITPPLSIDFSASFFTNNCYLVHAVPEDTLLTHLNFKPPS